MNLTPEQLEQCRKDFEDHVLGEGTLASVMLPTRDSMGAYRNKRLQEDWELWQTAWRPIPSVEEIENILLHTVHASSIDIKLGAQAIHRAFGGKE